MPNERMKMIVTLVGIPRFGGNDIEYETGFSYFIDLVRVRIAEQVPSQVTPNTGAHPVKGMPVVREITFCFDSKIDGRLIYAIAPNVDVRGAL
jgi:hypothetical protein